MNSGDNATSTSTLSTSKTLDQARDAGGESDTRVLLAAGAAQRAIARSACDARAEGAMGACAPARTARQHLVSRRRSSSDVSTAPSLLPDIAQQLDSDGNILLKEKEEEVKRKSTEG